MLELKSVAKQYLYGARVLHSLDMIVEDGEIVALLGGDGAGKTTLLKVIGAVTDCEGEITLDGKDIVTKTDDTIIVFDDLALFSNRTFYYNLAYPLKIRGYEKDEIDSRVKAVATKLGITACLYERVKKMPLIDRKRLAIARLFIRDARLILVDDITRGLDSHEAKELWNEVAPLLIEKAKEGASIIFATTALDEAISISNRLVIMHYGEIKQIGTLHDIVNNPSSIWAVQGVDCDYHFERAHLDRKEGKLIATVGLKTPISSDEKPFDIDVNQFEGRILDGYIGKDVYIGWRSNGYTYTGARQMAVMYALMRKNGYTLVLENGERVQSDIIRDSVSLIPKPDSVCLFDFASENSIIK